MQSLLAAYQALNDFGVTLSFHYLARRAIFANVNGKPIHHKDYWQLYETAARLDVPLSNGMTAALVFSGFNFPHDVALDNSGNLYVADTLNNRVRVFATPLTGGSTADRDFTGLNYPMGMTFDASNNFYLANCGAPAPATTYPPCVQGPSSVQLYNTPNNKTYLPLVIR